MVEIVENQVNFVKILKKSVKFDKIHPFLDKFNPYKENVVSEINGEFTESISIRLYRQFIVWVINVLLNGIFSMIALNIISIYFGKPPVIMNHVTIPAVGLTVWFVIQTISKAHSAIVEGRVKVARNMPK